MYPVSTQMGSDVRLGAQLSQVLIVPGSIFSSQFNYP